MISNAQLSDDGIYRYRLERRWEPGGQALAFIMLNPSTADASIDDPTIRRCLGYAKAWGYSALLVGNLFALRSTDPRLLYRSAVEPIGPDNDDWLERIAVEAGRGNVVLGWGAHGVYLGRGATVTSALRYFQPTALRLTKSGQPSHPLYLPASLTRVEIT